MSGFGTRLATALIAVTVLASAPAAAQQVRGSVTLESRMFTETPRFPDQRDATVSPSLALEPELTWDSPDRTWQLRLTPFVRLDAHDTRRTHVDLREAGLLWLGRHLTMFAGVGKVFWGKTEARHLVDIVNQTDNVEDIDGEDKLGQPMVSATLELPNGAVDVFLLPYFRERTFVGSRGRLRGPAVVADEAVFEADSRRWHPDAAVRLTWYVGDLDLGVSAFRGTSREPRLVPRLTGNQVELVPHYDLIDQVSVDLQWTRGATLWKLEALTRGGHGRRFAATTFGMEHTFFDVGPGSADLGILGEVMIDDRDLGAPVTVFDHDVFVGARWALNDIADTSILGGPIVDYETGETLAFLELERRIGDRWVLGIEGRWVIGADRDSPLAGLSRDDFLTVRLSRYF